MLRLTTLMMLSVAASSLNICLVATAQSPQISSDLVRVGPSVHVSSDLPADPHYEMEIAANPANSSQLLVCSMLLARNSIDGEVVTYVSFDRGKTWKLTLRTKGDDLYPSFDPDCQYGPGNLAYSLSEVWGPRDSNELHKRKIYNRIDRSMNGGKTWESSIQLPFSERAFLTVDHSAGPQHGWFYMYGQASFDLFRADSHSDLVDGEGIRVDWSPDQGQTVLHQWAPKKEGEHLLPCPGAVLSDGTLVFPIIVDNLRPPKNRFIERDRFIEIVRAKIQRPNWPLRIETLMPGPWSVNSESTGSASLKLAVDSSDGPFRDRLYLIWEDRIEEQSQIKLSFSSDKGKTWSRPRVINGKSPRQLGNPFKRLDDLHGLVAVNREGVVGVTWLDRRHYPGNLGWTVRFRASLDGGETFLPSIQVSSVDYNLNRNDVVLIAPPSYWPPDEGHSTNGFDFGGFDLNGGHTMGLAADADGKFHPLWVANPSGVPQLWTTDITVQGKSEENGSAELASLKDASKLVRLHFTNRRYNLKTRTLDFDLLLENISDSKISGPLKVRVLDAESDVGSVMVMFSDSETIADGTVLDFSSQFTGGVLGPGDVTKPLHVRFSIHATDPFPFIQPLSKDVQLAELATKVLVGSIEAPTKREEHGGADSP